MPALPELHKYFDDLAESEAFGSVVVYFEHGEVKSIENRLSVRSADLKAAYDGDQSGIGIKKKLLIVRKVGAK